MAAFRAEGGHQRVVLVAPGAGGAALAGVAGRSR
jgi:hypothetical protein